MKVRVIVLGSALLFSFMAMGDDRPKPFTKTDRPKSFTGGGKPKSFTAEKSVDQPAEAKSAVKQEGGPNFEYLKKLLTQRDEAFKAGDMERVKGLQGRIDCLTMSPEDRKKMKDKAQAKMDFSCVLGWFCQEKFILCFRNGNEFSAEIQKEMGAPDDVYLYAGTWEYIQDKKEFHLTRADKTVDIYILSEDRNSILTKDGKVFGTKIKSIKSKKGMLH